MPYLAPYIYIYICVCVEKWFYLINQSEAICLKKDDFNINFDIRIPINTLYVADINIMSLTEAILSYSTLVMDKSVNINRFCQLLGNVIE